MRNIKTKTFLGRLLPIAAGALASLLAVTAQAGVPGITGPAFSINAKAAHITQPDGSTIYSWGYGCNGTPAGFKPKPAGADLPNANCQDMQVPGPTLIVDEGQTVTITLANNLPPAAGNTSMLFPGFDVSATGGVTGLLTTEACNSAATSQPGPCNTLNNTVTYTFVASAPGTYSYFSGTQGDLQIEMGLYGAIVVLPKGINGDLPACTPVGSDPVRSANGESDFRLAASAFNHPASCYDREYLFQFSEIDPVIHRQVEEIATCVAAPPNACPTNMNTVVTEPYFPAYFMINGRSMPDNMDPHYAVQYPRQPYNGNPHMHPGELTLLRIIGQGRWQHPFHEHGNHVRVLARDGNLLLARDPANPGQIDPQRRLAGPLLFTTTTTPGQTMDGIFQWTGKGLNWDVYGHTADTSVVGAQAPCTPDANGYYTSDPTAPNYYEWCGDHNKPLEAKPFGAVGRGGPVTLPDPTILAAGPWFGGSPYLGPDATARAVGNTPIPPSGTVANDPGSEAGFAYMWHSHNEREITTNNIFPGGMLMMMLVDPRAFPIDESK